MKKIDLYAYCCNNLGDDLFVITIARRYPKQQFYLYVNPKFAKPFKKEKNIKVVNRVEVLIKRVLKKFRLIKEIRKPLKKSIATVRIGGSIFIEPENWHKPQEMKIKKNEFVIGANFGPFKSKAFFEYQNDIIRNLNDCCFRDSYSYNLFKNLANIRYAPDVLFGCDLLPKMKRGCGIGISVISLKKRKDIEIEEENYYGTISKFCDKCVDNNYKVTLFAFCKQEGDVEAINEILSKARRGNKINYIIYDGNTDEFLEKFNECEYILATRFHAMILGWVLGKKVLPITYSRKMNNVIRDTLFDGFIWNIKENEKYDAEELFEKCINSKQFDVRKYIKESEKQFEALDKFIERR